MTQRFPVDCANSVTKLHGVWPGLILLFFCALIGILRRQARLPFVGRQEDLLIIAAAILLRLHVDKRELPAVRSLRKVVHCHGMGMDIAGARLEWSDLVVEIAAG